MIYKVSTIILLILVLIFGFKYCEWKGAYTFEKEQKEFANQETIKLRKDNGELIVRQKMLETSNKSYIDSITKNFGVKNKGATMAVSFKETLRIDTTVITFHDSLFFYKDSGRSKRIFATKTRCFEIEGSVDTNGVIINKFISEDSVLIIQKEKGFLVKHPEITIVTKNPCKDVSEVRSVKLKKRPSIILRVIEGGLLLIAGIKIGTL